jgi:predicted DNA-binding transcriptional regulator AlpA
MQAELENLARTLPLEDLPKFLGDLRAVEVVAMLRVSAPAPTQSGDVLIDVSEAAERLGQSVEWLYRHQKELPFVRHLGRSLRCSSMGIDQYIKRGK